MTTPGRDYIRQMADYCTAVIDGETTPNPIIAAGIIRTLQEHDPDLLHGWLAARAATILTDYLGAIDRAGRAKARHGAAARDFGELVTRHHDGDPTGLAAFRARHVIDPAGTRKAVADMTGDDHHYVAVRYTESAERNTFYAAVHRAIAEKVGDRRTEEVFSPAQYRSMFGF
jgi:hypothetical protein